MRHPVLKRQIPSLGEAPGALIPVGEPQSGEASLSWIEYDADALRETVCRDVEAALAHSPSGKVRWLNVYGLRDPEALKRLGSHFGLHPLVLEDILNAGQRPKVEDYGDYLFIVSRVFDYPLDGSRLVSDQVYMVLGEGFVLTFQARPIGVFDAVRDRLRRQRGQVRRKGADYLAYSLLDAVIDDYLAVHTRFNERMEQVDGRLLSGNDHGLLRQVQRLKRDCLKLRRALLPLREVLLTLNRGEDGLFAPETQLYLRDAYDHTIQLLESLEMSREMVSDMLDLYLSTQSNRLNLQMRKLTVLTMIFMPLTLIAGIYGMNFEHMPELKWRYGYHAVLGAMSVLTSGLAWAFWKRKWI